MSDTPTPSNNDAWVEAGMVGDCPLCGEASGFHDDFGTCDAPDTVDATRETQSRASTVATAAGLVGFEEPAIFYVVIDGPRMRWFGPDEDDDPSASAIQAANFAEEDGGTVFEVRAVIRATSIREV